MHKVEKTVLVTHAAEKMFKLVDQVEDYPLFLPWCGGVDLLARDATSTSATLHINYHGLKQTFTTKNIKAYPTSMHIELVDGPFKHLNGSWHFIALKDDACKIEFKLNYEFASHFLEKMISPVFGYIASTFIDGFITRADSIALNHKD